MSEVSCKNCKWLEPDDDDMGCAYCHENSTIDGLHGNILTN